MPIEIALKSLQLNSAIENNNLTTQKSPPAVQTTRPGAQRSTNFGKAFCGKNNRRVSQF